MLSQTITKGLWGYPLLSLTSIAQSSLILFGERVILIGQKRNVLSSRHHHRKTLNDIRSKTELGESKTLTS